MRTSLTKLLALGVATAAVPLSAQNYSAKDLLDLKPVQSDVPRDVPSAAELENCQVAELKQNGWVGWELLDSSGRPLRRFADTNGDQKIDVWSYFAGGVETYRDIDSDANRKADQYRWLGTAGIRWAIDKDEDGTIDRWKQISAEEVSREAVLALANADQERFDRVAITAEQIDQLGLGKEDVEVLKQRATDSRRDFPEAAKRQSALADDASWEQFAADKPGLIPAGTRGSTRDVMVYESVVAVAESGKSAVQVLVGTLLETPDGWRLLDVPRAASGDEAIAQYPGLFFPGARQPEVAGRTPTGNSAEIQKLVDSLEDIDAELVKTSDRAELAKLNARRAEVLQGLAAAASSGEERETWVRQFAETVAAAVQNGSFPEGVERLQNLAEQLEDKEDPLTAYVRFNAISADYGRRLQNAKSDTDFAEAQETWLTSLDEFVEEYKEAPEAASALLQLGLSSEFEGEEQAAIDWYGKVVSRFPDTHAAVVAQGAANRIRSVGKQLNFTAKTVEGKTVSLNQFRGRPVVIHYWATWCEPCKNDMVRLRKLQAQFAKQNLQIVGVNVDPQQSDAVAFLRDAKLPWVHLYEPGGLEKSRLATQLGVQTLPLMMVLDKEGKVVRNNVHAAELDEAIEEALK